MFVNEVLCYKIMVALESPLVAINSARIKQCLVSVGLVLRVYDCVAYNYNYYLCFTMMKSLTHVKDAKQVMGVFMY